jgi:hypoxanthine phosphoribosyltransferase
MVGTPKLLVPSWDEVYSLLAEVANRIRFNYRPEVLVGIARGGLIPARIIADMLDISIIGSIGVAFYEDLGQTMKNPIITQPLNVTVVDKCVLLVDDIVDTGESLTLVASDIMRRAAELRTATIYRKPSACIVPDYFAEETDVWVVFPWELRETIKKICRKLLSSGMTVLEVKNYFRVAGLDSEHARTYLKEVCEGSYP